MYKIIGADGKEYGPVSTELLRQWIGEGRVNGQTRVLEEGAAEWKTIAQVPALEALVNSTPPPTPPGPIAIASGPRNNPYAVAGMTLGILALTLGVCCCYGLPFSVPGIICSSIALSQIKGDLVSQQGRGQAIAGLVLSVLSILLGILLLALGIALSTPDILRRIQRL